MTPGAVVELAEAEGWADMYAACPADLGARLGLAMLEDDSALQFLAPALDMPLFNRVIRLGLRAEPSPDALDRMRARFLEAGVQNYRFQPFPPAQGALFRSWTAGHGLVQRDRYAKLLRTEAVVPPARTSLVIEQVARGDRFDFADTACAGFGLPPEAAPWLAELVERPGWRCYVARDGEQAVASGAFRQDGATAWLTVGATRSTHRNRGAQSALIARRLADALASDAKAVVVETGEDRPDRPNPSLRNLLRAGFELVHWRDSIGPR